MSTGKWFLFAAMGLSAVSVAGYAEDTKMPATRPTAGETGGSRKLFEPYAMLKTLTPEQTAQIEKIHKDFLEQRRKLEAKQKDDIAAVLTPAQLTELTMDEDKAKADRKEKAMPKMKKATTEPVK